MTDQENFDLRDAPPFDVYTWSDYPEVNAAIDALLIELEALYQSRGKQFREKSKAKRYLKVMVMGLWAAVKLGEIPWRSISFDQAAYRSGQESRYNKIHLKARMVTLFKDLVALGYVEEKVGFYDRVTNQAYRTRIRALPSLIELVDCRGVDELATKVGQASILERLAISPETGLPLEQRESIRLKDADGKLIDYKDNRKTRQMRQNLAVINAKIEAGKVSLYLTDDQFEAMWKRLQGKKKQRVRRYIDFSQTSLHRVFNGSFDLGGRFYGGWWQAIPKDFRPYIEINHQSTVELDYSGHHVRMLYAQENLDMPKDPYDLEGYHRDVQKVAVMMILNANSEVSAIGAIEHKVFETDEGEITVENGGELLTKLKERHAPIAKYFHTGVGLELQNKDAKIAERLMLQMITQSNAVILPIHDSFLVSKGYEQELLEAMNDAFKMDYGQAANIKAKRTALELQSEDYDPEDEDRVLKTLKKMEDFDLEQYFKEYRTYYRIFGT